MSPPPVQSELAAELSELAHAFRQPLSAARLIARDLCEESPSIERSRALELLVAAMNEAIELTAALELLAKRTGER